jgi:hypothetical protein
MFRPIIDSRKEIEQENLLKDIKEALEKSKC